jgi:phosphoglycolate phosphatase
MNKKLVIFDFDGVLVNTMPLWLKVNKKTNPDITLAHMSEMSLGNFFDGFEKVNFVPSPTYHEDYHEGLKEIEVISVLRDTIHELSKDHYLMIVSSGSEVVIKKYLQKEEIENLFVEVLGFETHKTKTAKIKQILEKYGAQNTDAVFITDTLGDILESHEVGVPVIAETWGLHDEETLLRGNPEKLINDPRELLGAIKELLN